MTAMTLSKVMRPAASLPRSDAARSLLTAHELTVRFGDFVALCSVSLNLEPRGVHVVIGPNGAGKTTLFNAISGFVRLTGGRVRFNDADVTGLSANRLARLGLARSFQICSVFPELSVEDNIRMALLQEFNWSDILRRRAGTPLPASVEQFLEETGLASERNRRAADLSYGRRRLLEIVTTLTLRPRLLLLDEPMAGLAREDIPAVTALIARAAENCGVLMIEHNLQVVEHLATKVTVLTGGAVLCAGTYKEVATDPRVLEAYIGVSDA